MTRPAFGVFTQAGLGLPTLVSWRATKELAELCAKRYRRHHDSVYIYPITICSERQDLQ